MEIISVKLQIQVPYFIKLGQIIVIKLRFYTVSAMDSTLMLLLLLSYHYNYAITVIVELIFVIKSFLSQVHDQTYGVPMQQVNDQ